MIEDKPIHLCLRVKKEDIEKSKSYCEKINEYIWWAYYSSKKNPVAEKRRIGLNLNIKRYNNNLVFFIADKGGYVVKAKLFTLENEGTKKGHHVPPNWAGRYNLWIMCDNFEKSNLNELKSLVFENNKTKPYLDFTNRSNKNFPFRNQYPINLVALKETYDPPSFEDKLKNLFKLAYAELDYNKKYIDEVILRMEQIASDKGEYLADEWEKIARDKIKNEWSTDIKEPK